MPQARFLGVLGAMVLQTDIDRTERRDTIDRRGALQEETAHVLRLIVLFPAPIKPDKAEKGHHGPDKRRRGFGDTFQRPDTEFWSHNPEQAARRLIRRTVMTFRCDHCSAPLGLEFQRYYRMRFCCQAHKIAYERRLSAATRAKIRHLVVVLGAAA
jgi:hypothetical protein